MYNDHPKFWPFLTSGRCSEVLLNIGQGYATLIDSWATLETELVYVGQYKCNLVLFDLNFESNLAFKITCAKKEAF